MSITTAGGGNPVITIISPAKNGTLGAQGSIDADQIVLDDSLNATNNGDITDPLVGRLLILRRNESDEETKQIVEGADTDTTIRVHEDWTVPPASGDTYDISYVLGDTAAFTGMSLSAKTGVFEASRKILVGDGISFTYFAQKDQEAFEIRDNAANDSLEVADLGRFDVGFLLAGNPGAGGLLNTLNDGDGEPSVNFLSGSKVKINDAINFSFRASTGYTADVDAVVNVRSWKNINLASDAQIAGSGNYQDVSWTGPTSSLDTITTNETTVVDDWTVTGTNGFRSISGDTRTESITLKNIAFIATGRNILVDSNKTWDIINPVWTITTGSQAELLFLTSSNNEVNEKASLDITVQQPDGTVISGAAAYVYEGLLNQNLPTANRMFTEADGADSSDLLKFRYTSGSANDLIVTASGDFTLKVYNYARLPFLGALDPSTGIDQSVSLTADSNVTAISGSDALFSGSADIAPEHHGPGTTTLDLWPLKVFHYVSGAGTIPAAGQIVSGTTSNATGSVLEVVFGDNNDAFLVLSGWSGGQFTDLETIGNGVAWSAVADLTNFDEEYTWEYDCADFALQTVYDYDRAKLNEDPALADAIYIETVNWGANEQSNQFYFDGTSFTTERNVANEQGVWLSNRGAGTIGYMTSDSGSQFVPPQTVSFDITGLQLGTEVRIYNADTNASITGTESAVASTFSYSYVYSGDDINIFVVIFHLNWKDIRLTGFQLSSIDQSIPIQQITDRVFL